MRVFVYGTLKPGECNYLRYCEGKVVEAEPAIARGQLFQLSLGYPGMTTGDGFVQGYLLTFSDPVILADLDRLEDYHPSRPPDRNEYQRHLIEIFNKDLEPLGIAWAYLMQPARVASLQGVPIPDGCWRPDL